MKCTLDAVINAGSGNGLVYTYNDKGELASVMPGCYVSPTSYTQITDAQKVEYIYDSASRLHEISTISTSYEFLYDSFGNVIGITVGDNVLALYQYAERNGKLKKVRYANGFTVEYEYNALEMPEKVWYTDSTGNRILAYEYEYTAEGLIHKVKDNISGEIVEYTYDSRHRVSGISTGFLDDMYRNIYTVIKFQDDGKIHQTITNVNVVGNRVEDDNGAGIALYDDATLIMNGGSIRDNIADMTIVATIFGRETAYGAGIYAEESTVILENVTIQNNQFLNLLSKGAVIYAEDSDVTLNNCTVVSNGIVDKNAGWEGSMSIIHNEDSAITIKNTKFSNNGCVVSNSSSPCLIYGQGDLTIESCLFSENSAYHMIELYGHKLTVSDTSFVENYANVFYGYGESDAIGTFDRCTFGNNASWNGYYSFKFAFNNSQLIFTDCYFGNSTFNDRSRVKFVDSTQALAGSLIGEGSLTMIVSITALITSVTAIGLTLASNKKKKDTPETDDEE